MDRGEIEAVEEESKEPAEGIEAAEANTDAAYEDGKSWQCEKCRGVLVLRSCQSWSFGWVG